MHSKFYIGFIAVLLVTVFAILPAGCASYNESEHQAQARRACQAFGLTNIQVGKQHYCWLFDGGDKGDTWYINCAGKNAQGVPVRVIVYLGMWKNATVRVK